MKDELIRTLKIIDDYLITGLGIGTFISFLEVFSLYYNVTINDSDDQATKEQKQKLTEKRRRTCILLTAILVLLFIVANVIKLTGIVNVSDVFGVQNQYVGQTMNQKADGTGKKYTDAGYMIYNGKFRSNLYEGEGKLFDTWFDHTIYEADNGMVFEEDGLKKLIKIGKEVNYKPRLIY